jgi:hypothetical protein
VNAIPDKFAQWDVAYVLRRAVSSRTPGARGASRQLSHLPVGRLGTCCPPRSAGSGWARRAKRDSQYQPLLVVDFDIKHVHAANIEHRIGPGTPAHSNHRPVNPRPPGMLRQRRADDSTLPEELVLRRLD